MEQDSELLDKIKQYDNLMNLRLHLTFMFAMPLIFEYKNSDGQEEVVEFPKINYHEESLNVY
jgi:hypothetical protein